MQGQVADKILVPLVGKPLIQYSLNAFEQSEAVQIIVIVHRDAEQRQAIEPLVADFRIQILWTPGGQERRDSVYAGLAALPADTDTVLIHDCARPLVTPTAIRTVAQAARDTGAACLAHPVTDTLKRSKSTDNGHILKTLDRSHLWAMETPQAFQYPLVKRGYEKAIAENRPITDDLSAIEETSQPVSLIDNQRPNPKLTTPADLAYLEFLLGRGV